MSDIVPSNPPPRPSRGDTMQCRICGSANQGKFKAEMLIHFLGLTNIDKPGVWAYPELFVCLDCRTAEFVVSEGEIRLLQKAPMQPGSESRPSS